MQGVVQTMQRSSVLQPSRRSGTGSPCPRAAQPAPSPGARCTALGSHFLGRTARLDSRGGGPPSLDSFKWRGPPSLDSFKWGGATQPGFIQVGGGHPAWIHSSGGGHPDWVGLRLGWHANALAGKLLRSHTRAALTCAFPCDMAPCPEVCCLPQHKIQGCTNRVLFELGPSGVKVRKVWCGRVGMNGM